ncbi:hypothetical protein BDY17DRAFT_292321 [Neohortaea acidophila]|uniref:JmjC domain-containing protein n=1 Tax=Neohortaea acidophila TaxID=245834 RepID=A0A6A6Q3C2_9PEZI|nr:uncharacterized protein BDY17DRAFT_292321 [Neohortaea acidophila]KAF2486900.1 hypothetical protein BDY17DRAFT_292321 [Neohortaea acidophila]
MLLRRAVGVHTPQCRRLSTARGPRSVPVLPNANIDTFRQQALDRATPVQLLPNTFAHLPAIQHWFVHQPGTGTGALLNHAYLSRYGSTIVPLEFSNDANFSRMHHSLSFFLDAASSALTKPTARVYLAQAPIADLPQGLKDDVPTPDLVLKAGKGDVYDSSIWLGEAPTYTPLHRDPNPNLFVQLAGRKVVRLFPPHAGQAIFAKVQEQIGGSASETMRGEEMMQGVEKRALESEVWGDEGTSELRDAAWQVELSSGGGLFIPKGWWHSVKGVGDGMIGSVNWWFR